MPSEKTMSPAPLRTPRSLFRTPAALLCAGLLTVSAAAQVPAGTVAIGTSVSGATVGTSGIFLIPPTGGPAVPVTGLPPALTRPSGSGFGGVATMDLMRTDGSIVAGMVTTGSVGAPVMLDVYLLHLSGSAVVATQTIPVGPAIGPGGAIWVAAMPNGRVLIGAFNGVGSIPTPPMSGHMLAIVDPSGPTPTFTLIPNPVLPQANLGGLAVDPTGQYAYLPMTATTTLATTLYRLDLATGATCPLANWPNEYAGGISVDDDGTLYVSATNPYLNTNYVHTVQPNACVATVTTVATTMPPGGGTIKASGSALDRANHRFLLPSGYAPVGTPPPGAVYSVDPTGVATATVIATAPPAGWGQISRQGIVVFNAIDSYGPCTDGLSHYWFDNFSNPGGQPNVATGGNPNFSLTLRSTAPLPLVSALALSLGKGSVSMGGVQVLVDLPTTVSTFLVPASSQSHALPMPSNPALTGMLITAQSLHLESTLAVASSAGLAIRL